MALSVVSAGALALNWYKNYLSSAFDQKKTVIAEAFPDRPQSEPEPVPGEISGPQTILLLGSDSRGDPDDARSDSMMIVRVPEDRSAVYVVSFLRDSWVEIPGYGYDKINAAFSYGGLPLAVETVEYNLNTRIDHVMMVDFEGFKHITDALGGVTVNNEVGFELTDGGVSTRYFEEGELTLNGDEALQFVRERKSFIDGDYQRARNQQNYLKAVLNKILSAGTVSSPKKITGIVEGISPYISVDQGLTSDYMLALIWALKNVRSDTVVFFTVPTEGVGWSPDGTQSIINLDYERLSDLAEAFGNDTLGEYVDTHDLTTY